MAPKIFVSAYHSGNRLIGWISNALCEDGRCIASHASSDLEWAKFDIGFSEQPTKEQIDAYVKQRQEADDYKKATDTENDKVIINIKGETALAHHATYWKYFPEGFELEWINEEDLENHAGWMAAIALNHKLYADNSGASEHDQFGT